MNATLVANVAAAYFQLRELDLELEISKRALASRKESLELTKTLEEHGINSILDVRQAEQLVYTAAADIADLKRRIGQQEDFLSILLGNNPGPIAARKRTDRSAASRRKFPPGFPPRCWSGGRTSAKAEATAGRGQRANRRGQGGVFSGHFVDGAAPGFQSSSLASLFSGGAGLWTFAGTVTQPIFKAGQIRSNVRLAEAQQQEAVLTYQQTIQGAFRDVSDALIAYQQNQEFRAQEELLAHAAQDAAQLSGKRYRPAPQIIWKSSPTKRTTCPPNSASRRPASTNSWPWCKSTKRSAAAGSSNASPPLE